MKTWKKISFFTVYVQKYQVDFHMETEPNEPKVRVHNSVSIPSETDQNGSKIYFALKHEN